MTADFKQIDSGIDVVTPENISFQYHVAGPFRRLPAFMIDLVLRLALWFLSLIVISLLASTLGNALGSLGFAAWLLLWFLLEWFYGGLLEAYWNGQTVGKRLMGIRVLRTDGQPINGLQAVMRNILRLVDMMPMIPVSQLVDEELPLALPTCLLGLGAVMLSRRSQRLGDLVCGTMVVIEERGWMLSTVKFDDEQIVRLSAELPASFQISRKLSQALAAYAERRPYLSLIRRQEISRHLGEPLIAELGLPPETSHDLLLCALYHRNFVAERANHLASRSPTLDGVPPVRTMVGPNQQITSSRS